jgi:hypothetical protein
MCVGNFLGYWLLVIGYWFLVIGFWFLVIGFWLLVFGYWFLVIGLPSTPQIPACGVGKENVKMC